MEIKDTKRKLNECFDGINLLYNVRRLIKKPQRRIINIYWTSICCNIIYILLIIYCNYYEMSVLFYVLCGLGIFYTLFPFFKAFITYFHSKDLVDTFLINENGIKNTYGKNTFFVEWENIKVIIISKYNIAFCPIKLKLIDRIFFIRNQNNEKIIDEVKKYNKDILVIDKTI